MEQDGKANVCLSLDRQSRNLQDRKLEMKTLRWRIIIFFCGFFFFLRFFCVFFYFVSFFFDVVFFFFLYLRVIFVLNMIYTLLWAIKSTKSRIVFPIFCIQEMEPFQSVKLFFLHCIT